MGDGEFFMVFVIVVVVSSINMIIGVGGVVFVKFGFSGVELLLKEMFDMKLRDVKVDYSDDKVGSLCVWCLGVLVYVFVL